LLLTGHGDHGNCEALTTCSWREYGVAKAEWGLKRTCLSCGARFYDLQREPIVCPACGAAVDAAGPSKPRRARAAPAPARAAVVPVVVAEIAVVEDEIVKDVDLEADSDEDEEVAEKEAADEEGEDDGESAIEDVSELGDDDMADVIDTEIDEEETDR
jgi:uncharacterized protein (TIGR02300 family)